MSKLKTGPPTKASKGERKYIPIAITLPADLHDKIVELMNEKSLSKSKIIQILLREALEF
jgi:metal-responsive CopG/Arc/MetJ family transcriptional regulator